MRFNMDQRALRWLREAQELTHQSHAFLAAIPREKHLAAWAAIRIQTIVT
jgi:hypothetical protein